MYNDIEKIETAMVTLRRSQARRNLARRAEQQGATVDIGSFEVLDVIEAAGQAGEPVTVSYVAEALRVDQPRASRMVAAAVEAGLVRRQADQADGRRALLVRTARGRALTEQVHDFRRAMFAEAMAGWSASERATFARLLSRFVDGLG